MLKITNPSLFRSVLYKQCLLSPRTNSLFSHRHYNIIIRSFSCFTRNPRRTNKLTIAAHSNVITRGISIVSKTRLPNKPFWLVLVFIAVFYGAYFTSSKEEEIDELIEQIQNTDDLVEIADLWKKVYEDLYEAEKWEHYLKKGIVQLAILQLKELHDMVPFSEAMRHKLEKKKNTLQPGTQAYTDIVSQLYMFNVTVKSAERICSVLSRLSEIEGVAVHIAELGGLDTVLNYTLTGVDNFYLGDLWTSVLKHKKINQSLLLGEDEFVTKLEELAALNEPPYAIRQIYNTLFAMMRNPETRKQVLQNERIVNLITSFSTVSDDGFRRFFKDIYAMPVGTWENKTRTPKRQIVFREKRDLRDQIAKTLVFGAMAAAYCGVRWKRTLPHVATSVLIRKMATAFVGITAGEIMLDTVDYNTFYGPSAKAQLSNSALYSDPTKETAFRTFHTKLRDIVAVCDISIYLLAYYNAKFLLLPGVLLVLRAIYALPTKKDLKNGVYVKLVYQDYL